MRKNPGYASLTSPRFWRSSQLASREWSHQPAIKRVPSGLPLLNLYRKVIDWGGVSGPALGLDFLVCIQCQHAAEKTFQSAELLQRVMERPYNAFDILIDEFGSRKTHSQGDEARPCRSERTSDMNTGPAEFSPPRGNAQKNTSSPTSTQYHFAFVDF